MTTERFEIKGLLIEADEEKGLIEFPMWPGEFGWEVMRWIPYIRSLAPLYKTVVAHARPAVWPLYQDFCTAIIKRSNPGRGLEYPKQYRETPEMQFVQYGDPSLRGNADVVIHARGIRRKDSINYTRWPAVIEGIRHNRPEAMIAMVGTAEDIYIGGTRDLRGVGMGALCDILAGAKAVVGVSSGVMHLAALCTRGTIVAWADSRTYFGEPLEQRYKVTWNPFEVKVDWITSDAWDPEPGEIITRVVEAIDENPT
jgi:hypothetical protein